METLLQALGIAAYRWADLILIAVIAVVYGTLMGIAINAISRGRISGWLGGIQSVVGLALGIAIYMRYFRIGQNVDQIALMAWAFGTSVGVVAAVALFGKILGSLTRGMGAMLDRRKIAQHERALEELRTQTRIKERAGR